MYRKRLVSEFNKANSSGVDGLTFSLRDDDYYNWECEMDGPPNTLYEGGCYRIHFQIPQEYPLKPPKVFFLNKIFHPNIDLDNGAVCLNILKEDWKVQWNIMVCTSCWVVTCHV